MPRNQLPADPLDRLREQEETLELIQQEVTSLRQQRQSSAIGSRSPVLAITAESYNENTELHDYPHLNQIVTAAGITWLPIIYLDLWDYNTEEWRYWLRTKNPRVKALSVGWLSPWTIVEVAHDGRHPRIVSRPHLFFGRVTQELESAEFEGGSCDELVLGQGRVQIYKYLQAARVTHVSGRDYFDVGPYHAIPKMEPQYYEDYDPYDPSHYHDVMTLVSNIGGYVADKKVIAFSPDQFGTFVATVEPCAITCEV